MTTKIKDPVHGYIELPDRFVEGIVDTVPFQRLRRVRQLSATRLVYPAANHTRFEHALGVYHLGRTVFENLREESYFTRNVSEGRIDEIQRTLECACLLHDIGHPPFSHVCEPFLDRTAIVDRLADHGLIETFHDVGIGDDPIREASPHELLGCLIVLREFTEPLKSLDVDPGEVCAYLLGYSLVYERGGAWQYGLGAQLLHSPVDVDRLDYIIRDNRMTGANLLEFDVDRMVDAYTAHPEEGLALSERALSTLGNYLEGRIAVYMWVTQHHKSVYANALVRELATRLEDLTGEPPVTVESILNEWIGDAAVTERFRRTARSAPDSTFAALHDRYRARRFPKTCWKHRIAYADRVDVDLDEFSEWLVSESDRLERALADDLGHPRHEVWIESSYVPEYQPSELRDIPIAYGGRTRSAGDWGLYGDRAFDSPIPFVYVPEGSRYPATTWLVERFHAENDDT